MLQEENPFVFGEVVGGDEFVGRRGELAALVGDMRAGQNVVIAAPRRYGKTSLVAEAIRLAREQGVLVAYVDMFRTPTKGRFAERLAAELYPLVAPAKRLARRALDLFTSLPIRPKLTFGDDGKPEFEFGAGADTRDIDRVVESLLELPARIAADRGRRVVLVFDEFQEVIALDANLPAVMRSIFQLQTEVAHIFLGSHQHLMRRVFTDRNQPMYRMARPLLLTAIPAAEFMPFIHARFATTGMRIAAAAVERILATTAGHPHDTQQLCHATWATVRARGRDAVDLPDVERALVDVLDAETARYTDVWHELSLPQRMVLMALARDEDAAIFSEPYRREHQLGSASAVQSAVKRLIERQLVERGQRGSYRIADVFLRAWVARF